MGGSPTYRLGIGSTWSKVKVSGEAVTRPDKPHLSACLILIPISKLTMMLMVRMVVM
jgi:hypothetical protein